MLTVCYLLAVCFTGIGFFELEFEKSYENNALLVGADAALMMLLYVKFVLKQKTIIADQIVIFASSFVCVTYFYNAMAIDDGHTWEELRAIFGGLALLLIHLYLLIKENREEQA